MEGVPSVGGARGIFEIFIPGAFLFINIAGVVYISTDALHLPKDLFVQSLAAQPIPALTVLVTFSYLLGIVLRLLKAQVPDMLSGRYLWLGCRIESALFGSKKQPNDYLEEFPYFNYLDKLVAKKLPVHARDFYCNTWRKWATCSVESSSSPSQDTDSVKAAEGKRTEAGPTFYNREFINYCKTIINSVDSKCSTEMYFTEAMTRYVASMFYALVFSIFVVFPAAIMAHMEGLLIFPILYFLATLVILRNMRMLRVKEVEIVFAATVCVYYAGNWPGAKPRKTQPAPLPNAQPVI
jgi:hypothetical protein